MAGSLTGKSSLSKGILEPQVPLADKGLLGLRVPQALLERRELLELSEPLEPQARKVSKVYRVFRGRQVQQVRQASRGRLEPQAL